MTKKKKQKQLNKWLYIIFFTLPIAFVLLIVTKLDNDIWYLLSEGRYIIQNGIYHIDPLSMHSGFAIIVQNWLSASMFWLIYNSLGEIGLLTMVIIANFFICLLIYKICNLLDDNNKVLSLVLMIATDVTLTSHFVVSRPQVLSFIVLLSLIYILELYIKTDNWKYLIWIPILSLIEINMHASLWWMLFLFMLPYIIDSFKIPYLNTQGFKKKPLFIAIAIAFLVGFINPYGYKAITFIFTSFGDKYMHVYIKELLPFNFNTLLCKHMFTLMLITGLFYTYFRKGNIRIRYICLYCGTLILGFISIKGFSHYILVSLFPLAYFFKDTFPKDFSELPKNFKKGLSIFFVVFGSICILFTGTLYIKSFQTIKLTNNADEAINVLDRLKANKKTTTVYSTFNDGGYVEFRGYKPYIDPRAEAYLKVNNKKEDIFKENYDLQHGNLNIKDFLDKYNFDYLLVAYSDYLYTHMPEDSNYFLIYTDYEKAYSLYARNDLFEAKERTRIINTYNTLVEEAKLKDSNS